MFRLVLYIFLAVILLLFVILWTKIKVELIYKFEIEDRRLTIIIKLLFGMLRFRFDFPQMDKKASPDKNDPNKIGDDKHQKSFGRDGALTSFHEVKRFIDHIPILYRILKEFLKKVQIKKISWKSAIGTGNAATTGVAAGSLWTFKGSVIGIISYYFSLQTKPELQITPVFNRAISHTHIKCMFHVKTGHAILAGLRFLIFWRKRVIVKHENHDKEVKSVNQEG